MPTSWTWFSRKRRWIYATATALLLIVLVVPPIIAHVAERKLAALVRKHLNATLVVGRCTYWPPYTLVLRNAKLIARLPGRADAPLLNVDKLEIKLGAFPRNDQTLRINQIVLVHPVLHLSIGDGMIHFDQLLRRREQHGPPEKPSQQFRVSHLLLADGEITYGEQALRALNAKVEINPKDAAEYHYLLSADNVPDLQGQSNGEVNIDQSQLSIQTLHLTIAEDAAQPLHFLPPSWQEPLLRDHASGRLSILGSGRIPLKHAQQSTFVAQVRLRNWRADNADWPAPLDDLGVELLLSRADGNKPTSMQIADLHASSGPATLRLQRGTFSADPKTRQWSFTELAGVIEGQSAATRNTTRASVLTKASRRYQILGRVEFTAAANGSWPAAGRAWPHVTYKVLAYARNSSFVVPKMQAPVDRIYGGPVLFTDHHTTMQNLSAHYGDDVLQIANARLNFTDPQAGLGISAIDANIRFDRHSPAYPPPVRKYLDELHPQGTFHATGRCVVLPAGYEPRYDYAFNVTSPDASFALGSDLFPIDHAHLAVTASGEKILLTSLRGTALGGTLKAGGEVNMSQPIAVSAHATFADVDVRQGYKIIASGGGRKSYKINQRVSGKASGDVHVENKGTDWQTLTSGGTCEITGGDFGAVPILTQLVNSAHLSNVDFTGSEAAAVFTVAQKTVHLSNTAISAPAIGIQGDGEVKFDGTVHLHAVVAPLADWRQKLKSTGIPFIGSAAGDLQTILNRATRFLIYEFHVTGNIRDPKVMPVPVPILTKTSGRLFSHMLGTEHKENLLQLLHIEATTRE